MGCAPSSAAAPAPRARSDKESHFTSVSTMADKQSSQRHRAATFALLSPSTLEAIQPPPIRVYTLNSAFMYDAATPKQAAPSPPRPAAPQAPSAPASSSSSAPRALNQPHPFRKSAWKSRRRSDAHAGASATATAAAAMPIDGDVDMGGAGGKRAGGCSASAASDESLSARQLRPQSSFDSLCSEAGKMPEVVGAMDASQCAAGGTTTPWYKKGARTKKHVVLPCAFGPNKFQSNFVFEVDCGPSSSSSSSSLDQCDRACHEGAGVGAGEGAGAGVSIDPTLAASMSPPEVPGALCPPTPPPTCGLRNRTLHPVSSLSSMLSVGTAPIDVSDLGSVESVAPFLEALSPSSREDARVACGASATTTPTPTLTPATTHHDCCDSTHRDCCDSPCAPPAAQAAQSSNSSSSITGA